MVSHACSQNKIKKNTNGDTENEVIHSRGIMSEIRRGDKRRQSHQKI